MLPTSNDLSEGQEEEILWLIIKDFLSGSESTVLWLLIHELTIFDPIFYDIGSCLRYVF